MLSIFIGAVAAVSFAGGSPSELAKSIAEATKSNVVIEAGTGEYLRPFSYVTSNLDEMSRGIFKSTEFKQAPGEDFVYSRPWLPAWHFKNATLKNYLDPNRMCQWGGPPENAFKDSKVTIHCQPRNPIPIMALEGMKFEKPLSIDQFFMHLGLHVWVTDMAERDFLGFVCKAVGGKLKQTKYGLSLEPAGTEIQRRALATIEKVKKLDVYTKRTSLEKAEVELSRTAISSASAVQLEQLYGEEGKPIRIEIGPSARSAVMQMIRALIEPQPEAGPSYGPPQQTSETAPKPEDRFKSVDRRVIGWVVLSKGFQAHAELATVDQLGRPGPVLRVP